MSRGMESTSDSEMPRSIRRSTSPPEGGPRGRAGKTNLRQLLGIAHPGRSTPGQSFAQAGDLRGLRGIKLHGSRHREGGARGAGPRSSLHPAARTSTSTAPGDMSVIQSTSMRSTWVCASSRCTNMCLQSRQPSGTAPAVCTARICLVEPDRRRRRELRRLHDRAASTFIHRPCMENREHGSRLRQHAISIDTYM